MHAAAYGFVLRIVRDLPTVPLRVVEIGAREINGSLRPLFPGCRYTGVDIEKGDGVDVVADGATWLPDEPADVVVCCEVLEHAPQAEAVVANLLRMVRPGGLLIITAAGPGRAAHSGVDGGPPREGEHYRNIPPEELVGWLAGLPILNLEADQIWGDVRAMGRKL
jgi:SAM-dependent methyltransferase